ncbi:unnamed protein product [Caenorhabditis brenneri]
MEDSRSDDERPEQKEEDPGATRRDDTASQDAQGLRESGGRDGPSTSDAAARRESDEAVSETGIPTETQESGDQEGPSTSRKPDQDTECRPASTVDSPEESESPERMDPSVVPPVDSSAPTGAQPSEIAQPPEYLTSIGNASAYKPPPSCNENHGMNIPPPVYAPPPVLTTAPANDSWSSNAPPPTCSSLLETPAPSEGGHSNTVDERTRQEGGELNQNSDQQDPNAAIIVTQPQAGTTQPRNTRRASTTEQDDCPTLSCFTPRQSS